MALLAIATLLFISLMVQLYLPLRRGVDTVVSGVDESVCCVNSVLPDGILDLCGVDTVVSGVDESV